MHSTRSRFFIYITTSIVVCLVFCTSENLKAQDDGEVITQFRRTVFNLQQEMLELKNKIDLQERELRAQKEELGLQVERLNQENSKMRKHLQEMDSLLFQMEDRLESSSLVNLSNQLETLRNFNQAMIMDSVSESDQSEKILLDILNQPDSTLPKDLLILILAQQKKRQKQYEESISYYSTLLAEFSDSAYFSQAIFELSSIFGKTEKKEQQLTLLAQLSSLSETDPYSKKAQEKLKELGAEDLFEEAAIKPDATSDLPEGQASIDSRDTTDDSALELTADIKPDTTSDIPEGLVAIDSRDTTDDSALALNTEKTGDVSGDVESIASELTPEKTGDTSGDGESNPMTVKDDSRIDATSDGADSAIDESYTDPTSDVTMPTLANTSSTATQIDATSDISPDTKNALFEPTNPATASTNKEEPDTESAGKTSKDTDSEMEEKPEPEPDYTPENQPPNNLNDALDPETP